MNNMKKIIQLSLIMMMISLVSSAPLSTSTQSTCPCREENISKVSICAETADDPAWCKFHMCAPSFECVDKKWATHTCITTSTTGIYKCLFTPAGMIIKPEPSDHERCKCAYFPDQVIEHLSPL